MRRPAPLPASEEETAPARVTGLRRRKREAGTEPAPQEPQGASGSQDASGPQGDPDARADGDQPTSTRDVWRASRARRKALRAEIRRFTQRSRRRRLAWLSGIGAVLLLIGGSAAAAYSPLFAVEKITVAGATSLDPAAVEAALADQIGTPLALVDASAVKAALLVFPLIETYALEAKLPHDLTVRIVERTPVGVVRSDAGYTLLDMAGVVLSTTAEPPAGQPLLEVEGGAGSPAFESAGRVVRSLPADVRAALTGVRATTADDVTLTLNTGLTVVWGSAEDSALKGRILATTLAARPDASTIDVTSPEVAVVG